MSSELVDRERLTRTGRSKEEDDRIGASTARDRIYDALT
jgi:hypothetical protein